MRRSATDFIGEPDVFSPTAVSRLQPLDPLIIPNARAAHAADFFAPALLPHYPLPHQRLPAAADSRPPPQPLLPHVRYQLGVVGTLPPAPTPTATAPATPSLTGISAHPSPRIQFISPPAILSRAQVNAAGNPLSKLVRRVCSCVGRFFGACIYEVARALHVPRRHRCRLESDATASAHSSLSPSDARCEFYYCRRATTTTTTTRHTETTTLFRKPVRPGRRTSSRSPSLLATRFRENPLYSSADLAAAKPKAPKLQPQISAGSSQSCGGFMVSSKEMGARRPRHSRLGVASGTIRCSARNAAAAGAPTSNPLRPQDSLSDEAEEGEAHTMITSVGSSLEGSAATAAALAQLRRDERMRRLSQDLDSSSGSNVLYEQTAAVHLDALVASAVATAVSAQAAGSSQIVKSYSMLVTDLNNNSSSSGSKSSRKLARPTSTIEHSRVELEAPVGNACVNHKVKECNETSKTRLESLGDAAGRTPQRADDAQLVPEASTASLNCCALTSEQQSDVAAVATEAEAAATTTATATAASPVGATAGPTQSNAARAALQPTFSFSYEYSSEQSDEHSDAEVDEDVMEDECEQQQPPDASDADEERLADSANDPMSLAASNALSDSLRPPFSESSSSPNVVLQSPLPASASAALSPLPLATQCDLNNMMAAAAYGPRARVPVPMSLAQSQSQHQSMADSFQLALPAPYSFFSCAGVPTPLSAAAVLASGDANGNCALHQQLQMGAAAQQQQFLDRKSVV